MKPLSTDLLKQLNLFLMAFGIRFYTINNGGCGIFAELLFRFLRRHDYNAQIVVSSYQPETIQKAVETNTMISGNQNHVFVVVEDQKGQRWMLDADGIAPYESDDDRYVSMAQNVDLLNKWNDNVSVWNNWFDRNQVPIIEHIFNSTIITNETIKSVEFVS